MLKEFLYYTFKGMIIVLTTGILCLFIVNFPWLFASLYILFLCWLVVTDET